MSNSLIRVIRFVWMAIKGLLILGWVPICVGVAALIAFATLITLPLPGTLPTQANKQISSIPSQVYDAAGNLIDTYRSFDLTVPSTQADVPSNLKNAVVASEDRTFYRNNGVDLKASLRAAYANYSARRTVQGGSTITQQYVKLLYSDPNNRTISNKIKESVLAVRLSHHISKDELMWRYLDLVYFGEGNYGAAAAAQSYFHLPLRELNVSQAAALVGEIPDPSPRSLRNHFTVAEHWREVVLQEMLDQHLIDQGQYSDAIAAPLALASGNTPPPPGSTLVYPAPSSPIGPYPQFSAMVRAQLVAKYGLDRVTGGGLQIHTTLDPKLQAKAQAAVASTLNGTRAPLDMSLVSVDPMSGQIKTYVGGRDYKASQVDLASGGSLGFQPGSSFKPFVLAEALIQGMTPDTVIPAPDVYTIPNCKGTGCSVHNDEGGGNQAPVPLRQATWFSINTVYAQLIERTGTHAVATLANAMGVTHIDPNRNFGASLALGAYEVSPLDMAAAYSVFADHGLRHPATAITQITDASGQVIEDDTHLPTTQVLDPAIADTVTDILQGVIQFGTGNPGAMISRPAAGKTGTTSNFQAAWFVGYTPQLATAAWMGDVNKPTPLLNIKGVGQVFGGTWPARTWANFMTTALVNVPPIAFTPPGPLPSARVPVTTTVPQVPTTFISPGRSQTPLSTPSGCDGPCQ